LNAEGVLLAPPFELLECLATARHVHAVTRGLFDPTVQPLWEVLAQAWASGRSPAEDQLARARALIGFGRLRFESGAVVLAPGQRLTLNGIAQGYIADRIARLMRQAGVDDVLIDTGEISALGVAPNRQSWEAAIEGRPLGCRLTNRALATSAHAGTVLDAAGHVGHILHPMSTTVRRPAIDQISISAPSAALADALSTGLCLAMNSAEVVAVMKNVELARIEDIRSQSQT
jgi:thiamine biosynthesis lipoprotein